MNKNATTHLFIIDDDPVFSLITIEMLNRLKLNVPSLKISECENGEIGLNGLEKISGSKENVIVLLDINMPVLDGWGFLDRLNQNKNYGIKEISVYMVSSSTDENDIIKAKGYDNVRMFIHKPMDLKTLKTIVSEY